MDIVFIGSGAATTTTLIELLDKALLQGHKKLEITVIEKHYELWTGIPYGLRSSINALTITHTADFVYTEKEKPQFQDWLKAHKGEWVNYYRKNGGLAADNWLRENLDLVEAGQWDKVYLPRFVYGIYTLRKLTDLIEKARRANVLDLQVIHGEATETRRVGDGYEIVVEQPDGTSCIVVGKKVVLAVGSAPVKHYEASAQNYLYINELYQPSAEENIAAILKQLKASANPANKNVLVIGSNASSVELLYLLNYRPDVLSEINQLLVISRAGAMPNHLSEDELADYPTHHLDKIKGSSYDVHQLVIAMKKDLADAIDDTVIVPHINRIIGYTIELLQSLGQQAKEIFFSVYGAQISKIIRRSGPAYKGAAEQLQAINKLSLLKGEFVSASDTADGAELTYIDTNEKLQTYPLRFEVLVNCSGSDTLKNTSSRILRSVIKNSICRTTVSGEGILVNDKFEAFENFYVMGPLLAGNMNRLIHFWHLENVSRLLYLAPYLADELLS